MGNTSHRVEGDAVVLTLELASGEGPHFPSSCLVWGPHDSRYVAPPRPLSPPEVRPGQSVYEVRFPDEFEPSPSPVKGGVSYAFEWRSSGSRRVLLGQGRFEAPFQKGERVPHQLEVVLDYMPDDRLVYLVWSYPYGQHPIPEQTVRIELDNRPKLRSALEQLKAALESRIAPEDVHLPHQNVTPSIRTTRFGFYVRGGGLRRASVDYTEDVAKSTKKRTLTVPADEFNADEREAWRALTEEASGVAWQEYQGIDAR